MISSPDIYLTSFRLSHGLAPHIVKMSVAMYPPKGYEHIPQLSWALIADEHGQWIRPRNFVTEEQPLQAYHDALYAQYKSRLGEAVAWSEQLSNDVALLCWCPYDRAAQRQLGDFGSFVCHTAVLSEFIFKELGLAVWEDGDRRHMAVLEQRR